MNAKQNLFSVFILSYYSEIPGLLDCLCAVLPIPEQVLSCVALDSLKSGSIPEMALYCQRQSLDLLPINQK